MPDQLPALRGPLAPFDPAAYTRLRGGHGVAVLQERAVAPLVAAARGYETVTPAGVHDAISRLGLGDTRTRSGRKLKAAAATGDVMIMPWYRYDVSAAAAAHEPPRTAEPGFLQMRPAVSGPGRPKYEGFEGVPTVLDLHPATPATWPKTAGRILIAEGLIKGDSVLTALLRANGATREELSDDSEGARERLRALMEKVPQEERLLIISMVGVGNWSGHAEVADIPINGKVCWVATDADAAKNLMVWRQTDKLMSYLEGKRAKSVRLIDLNRIVDGASEKKMGLDDFFYSAGRFEDLSLALGDLPPSPQAEDSAPDGTWRISPDGLTSQVSRAVNDPSGSTNGGTVWVPSGVDLGGRIVSVETPRQPTDQELRTGIVDPSASDDEDPADTGVAIEVAFRDPVDDTETRCTITGPVTILNYTPREWARQGARIPQDLLRHPHWPPTDTEGMKWLRAVKMYRREETDQRPVWRSMGWVPALEDDASEPSFVVGRQVITYDSGVRETSRPGVSDLILSGAESFGVMSGPATAEWKKDARDCLETVCEVMVSSNAWSDRGMAGTVIGTALRPCLPIPNRLAVYLVGQRRSGKSWTAGKIMSFWQPRPGTWSGDHLPGSAKDTVAATEIAMSMTPIWVTDDLAPSGDRNQQVREEEAIGTMIRNKHNGSGKRRASADMTSRKVLYPRAALVITAENEPKVSSVTDRVVALSFRSGSLHPDRSVTDRVDILCDVTGEPSMLTGYFIRWFLERVRGHERGWAGVVEEVREQYETAFRLAHQRLHTDHPKGDPTRHARMAAEVTVTLSELLRFAHEIGASPKVLRMLAQSGLQADVNKLASDAFRAQSTTTPGHRFLEAVRSLLASGAAYVASIEEPTKPPVPEEDPEHEVLNAQLGWKYNGRELTPSGTRIGYAVYAPQPGPEQGPLTVILDGRVAFTAAQRAYPDLIPYGQMLKAATSGLWDDGLTLDRDTHPNGAGWARRLSSTGQRTTTVKVSKGGRNGARGVEISGVPILVDVLLRDNTEAEAPDQDSVDVA